MMMMMMNHDVHPAAGEKPLSLILVRTGIFN
jgi:hypothetical protein